MSEITRWLPITDAEPSFHFDTTGDEDFSHLPDWVTNKACLVNRQMKHPRYRNKLTIIAPAVIGGYAAERNVFVFESSLLKINGKIKIISFSDFDRCQVTFTSNIYYLYMDSYSNHYLRH